MSKEEIQVQSCQILDKWIESCRRGGKISRNTVSVGIVVLEHLRQHCPTSKEDVVSPGGEIRGARGGLKSILRKYDIPEKYLKEVTTRQGHQDGQRLFEAFDWGNLFLTLSYEERQEVLDDLIGALKAEADRWIQRQNLKLDIDRRQAPTQWIHLIVESAKSRSGGVVEQHLVGAKLERRFHERDISNHPAHAADWQTAREGDFTVSNMVYHVTANPSRNVVLKCIQNIRSGMYPILLAPKETEYVARALAKDEGYEHEITIIAIEDFVAVNIIELATERESDLFNILQEIVQIYNRRLAEVETDMSLRIEVK